MRKRIIWAMMFAIALGFWLSGMPSTFADTVELTETYIIPGFGFSIDLPADWTVLTDGPVLQARGVVLSDSEDGTAYLVGIAIDHRSRQWLKENRGLPLDATLEDLVEFNKRVTSLGELELFEVTEVEIFGVPALRTKSQVKDAGGPGIMYQGFKDDEAFLIAFGTGSEEEYGDFLPIWNKILESIRPVDEE
ncbi:MAG: hypothetical protein ACE5JP_10680 [Candidatus Bipolaricaulia bacterium]